MNRSLKILLAATLCTAVLTQDKICEHLGFGGQAKYHEPSTITKQSKEVIVKGDPRESNASINDFLYLWDEQLLDWVPVNGTNEAQSLLMANTSPANPLVESIELKWKVLMDIRYRLRYFEELAMEIYAPVFPRAIKDLDGKEVIIEGFVIPFDEEAELLSLSYNPYASCFFCGKASPASVISMYLRDKGGRYKMDDFKKFRGTLNLNYDDPNEFYYILRDAREE